MAPVALAISVVVAMYFAYITFVMAVPAWVVGHLGTPATREFVIEEVKKASRRATLCPYRLRLHGAVTVLADSFCVSEAFSLQHASGQSIQLVGRESFLGFRFTNVD